MLSRVQPKRIFAVAGAGAGARHAGDDLANPLGIAQQIRTAFGLFGHVADRAAEVDIDRADAELENQPPADFGHLRRIVVPYLHGQRPRLVLDAPQPFGQFAGSPLAIDESPCAHHLGGDQSHAPQSPQNSAVGVAAIARQGRRENRRIDNQRADAEGLHAVLYCVRL